LIVPRTFDTKVEADGERFPFARLVMAIKSRTAIMTVAQMAALAPMVILSMWFIRTDGVVGLSSRHWLPGGTDPGFGLISLYKMSSYGTTHTTMHSYLKISM